MTNDEIKWMLVEFLAEDSSKDPCIIEEKKFRLGKFSLLKQIDNFISEMEAKEIEIDLQPYRKLSKSIRQLREAQVEELMQEMAQGN